MKRLIPTLLLLPLLALLLGVSGAQLSEEEAARSASLVPELAGYADRLTVETTASYQAASDAWEVTLTEQTSDEIVATAVVADDTGEVSQTRVTPEARTTTYPELSEELATEIATANEEAREELSTHEGGYRTSAEYEDGSWTVHFTVEGDGPIGGLPKGGGRKEVARVEIDDSTLVASEVHV
ncbi:MAG: hypothetical protein ACRDSJ_03810, partial [Rubrobacteraceae bacterium]